MRLLNHFLALSALSFRVCVILARLALIVVISLFFALLDDLYPYFGDYWAMFIGLF